MKADQSRVRALVIETARLMRAEARAARERARRALAEDRARRLRMSDQRRGADRARRSRRGHSTITGTPAADLGPAPATSRGLADARRPSGLRSGDGRNRSPLLPPGTPFGLRSEAPDPSRVVLRVSGDIDMATAPALGEALQFGLRIAEPGSDLIADLTAVTFIDARGLAALLEAAETARSRELAFRLVGCPPCVLWLLELTGTRHALDLR